MKLLVDTERQRVLYAEASKDVVDFLFSLLALRVGPSILDDAYLLVDLVQPQNPILRRPLHFPAAHPTQRRRRPALFSLAAAPAAARGPPAVRAPRMPPAPDDAVPRADRPRPL